MNASLGGWGLVLLLALGAQPRVRAQTPVTGPPSQTSNLSRRTLWVDDEPSSCEVSGKRLRTKLDCAIAHAHELVGRSAVAVLLKLGPGTYETYTGLQMTMADLAVINIHGAGKGPFNAGTVIRQAAPINSGVLSFPFRDPSRGEYWTDLNLQGFSVDASGNAPMCMDLYALGVAHLSDLSCSGATGPRAWMRIGGYGQDLGGMVPQGKQGLSFQVMASDVFIYNSGGPGATVRARVAGGHIVGYVVEDAGFFRQRGEVPIYLKGPIAGEAPCAVMPRRLQAQLADDPAHPGIRKLVAINASDGGSGCKETVRVAVPDMPAARFGFEIAATDSTFYDLTDDSVGQEAGIEDRGSTGSVFYHPHAWNVWDAFHVWGNDSFVDAEVDSVYNFGFRIRWGESTHIVRPSFVNLKHEAYASAGDFFLDPGAKDTVIDSPACLSRNLNGGYTQFSRPEGAFFPGYGLAEEMKGAEASLEVIHNRSCGPKRVLPEGLQLVPGFGADGAVRGREMVLAATNTGTRVAEPFWIATVPSRGAAAGEPAASLRVQLAETHAGEPPSEASFLVTNGEKALASAQVSPSSGQSTARSRVAGYRQADGSVKLLLFVAPGSAVSVRLDMVTSPKILLIPEPEQVLPSGVAAFSSGKES